MNNLNRSGIVVLLIVILASCSSRKKIVYFNDFEQINRKDTIENFSPISIQTGDLLLVTVSTIDPTISALFNPTNNYSYGTPIAPGYRVDPEGYIEMPMIGKVFVRGKTTQRITEDVKLALEKSIKNVFVTIRLLNFRISLLGDVARPGNYTVQNERISILEALSMAGDANLTANKNDILLIREREGKKEYVTIDLNNSKSLSSPYFYLTNNDVIYVKPGINRVIANTTSFQLLPTLFSALSLGLVVFNTFRR